MRSHLYHESNTPYFRCDLLQYIIFSISEFNPEILFDQLQYGQAAMRRIFTLAVVGLLVATAFSASAFTTGYVDRTASINVASDSSGLIQLSDGTSGDLIHTTNGELTIDFSNGGANGANSNASFTIGNSSNASQTYAFDISHTDNSDKTLSLNYTADSDPNSGVENVKFAVYDNQGTELFIASEESGPTGSYSLGTSETVYVVVTVDTTGVSSTEALDGTLRLELS